MIGQTLGHYRLLEKIGEGGMGVVYRAHDERLDRDVALKLLPAGMLANLAAVKSFREEAQALSKLNHPNIATIHDFDAQDGLNFLVMEYVHGATLFRKIAAGPLPEKEVIRLGTQLVQGLQAAHSKGVIHRDLKPSNLAVTADCRLKILDFGLARFSESVDPNLTQTFVDPNAAAGTLPYMAPELLQGQPADERSDVYAAGAVLYEMTTGQRLFPDKHGARLLDAILHRSVRPPRDLNSRVSPELQDIIQKALDKDPDRRYQSARELKVDLQRLPMSSQPGQPLPDQEPTGPLPLEIAHVLFMDIVAYSRFPIDQQKQLVEELQKTVRGTSEFARAKSRNNLISLPSGDGMALVFFNDPESPCRCALEVSRIVRNRPDLKLRMGVHTGPVYRTADINTNRNVAGGGINLAQRVMDCGDAGHILVSKTVAEMLAEVSSWSGCLHDVGETEVKHGQRIHLYNLYTEDAGNPTRPVRVSKSKSTGRSDPGRIRRSSRSGVHAKDRSGIKTPSEIRGKSEPAERWESKAPQTKPGRPGRLKKLRLTALAVLVFAVLAFAVPQVFRKAKAAPPGVPPLADGKYLAIMPFDVEGDAATLTPVAESLNQQLSAKLLSLRGLRWVASARAAEEVDRPGSLEAIGGKLGANLVVRGTVRGDNKKINVHVELDEVPTGRRRMNRKFPGMRGDLLNLQDQIYTQLLQVLEVNPTIEEMERAALRPTQNPEAYDLYNRGRSVYRGHPDASQVKSAIGYYEEALQKDPDFALAHASLADASLRMYRETQDVLWMRRASDEAHLAQKLDDNRTEVHLSLGNVYRATGKTDEAIEEFKRAIQISPRADDGYRRLGQVYEDLGKKSQALTSFQNAVTLNPYYWSNLNELGDAYQHFGEYEKALVAFRRVVELDPTNPLGHENIGAVYFLQAKYDDAIPEFTNAIALQSSNADVYSDLGLALLFLKRYPEALQYLEKSAQMQPNNQVIVGNLADGYRWAGHQKESIDAYDRAISLANKALAVNPRDATALGSLASYHAKKGDIPLAEHYIRRARSVDPADVDLVYIEATTRALSNQPELALESLRLAFEKGVSPEQARLDPDLVSLQENTAFRQLVKEFLDRSNQVN